MLKCVGKMTKSAVCATAFVDWGSCYRFRTGDRREVPTGPVEVGRKGECAAVAVELGEVSKNDCVSGLRPHHPNPTAATSTQMKNLSKLSITLIAASLMTAAANADDHKKGHGHGEAAQVTRASPKGAKVYIVNLRDGKTVKAKKGKVKVIFGVSGMGICPAGITASGQPIPNTGHHHLLVDVDKVPPLDQPLPADKPDTVKHFGKGQTEVDLELKPGKHTLQLVFADYGHYAHNPPVVSKKITITVK